MLLKDHEIFSQVHPTKNTHVNVLKLKSQSNAYLSWVCPTDPTHEWDSKISNRTSLGRGCPYCSGQKPIIGVNDFGTTDPALALELVDKSLATELFGKSNTKVEWICKRGHTWVTTVYSRTSGTGCGYCSGRFPIVGETDIQTTDPELAAQLKDQSLATKLKRNTAKKVEWVCLRGHTFSQSPNARTSKGYGCQYCSGLYPIVGETDIATTHPEFSAQLVNIEDTTGISYGSTHKVEWRCDKGHIFSSTPNDRTREERSAKNGCRACGNIISAGEIELQKYVLERFPDAIFNSRKIIKPLELDIYIPSLKTAIEYNGVFFHSEKFKGKNYHRDKLNMCTENGIRLIQIWDDDYRLNKSVVLSTINHKLGLSEQERIPARKTTVEVISSRESAEFLTENHIQGKATGTYYLGLKEKETEKLVAVMVLKRSKDTLTLDRYASNSIVPGGQSKLLSYVDKNISYDQMITFADLSISDGSLYEKTGWVKDKELPPDYSYYHKNRRVHKFNYRKDRIKNNPDLLWEEGLTERQLTQLNKLLRVYDSGKIRYRRTKP